MIATPLIFQKLSFLDGLNITIRLGNKWDIFNQSEKRILRSLDGDEITANILSSFSLSFKMIPANLLKLEHDPDCRNCSGLYHTICRMYPGFSINDTVTIVFFIPEKR
jgi:hypothetical protein